MLARTEPACLVIADISGYSGYLAGVELDHAQDILADLIGTIVGALRPAFKLAKLEGDAAFMWVPAVTVDGPALQDTVERCYYAFQRRVRDIRQASSCECDACTRIPGLDLKFVAHHGSVARQRMAGQEELVGSDVVVVHRLLKNHIAEELGVPAYVLYTNDLVRAMGLADPVAAGMREYRGTYESVGEVSGWVVDLAAAWKAEQSRVRSKVTDQDAWMEVVIPAPVPRDVLWEWTTSPARRVRWSSGPMEVVEDLAMGRRGVGAVNHCAHGKDLSIEEILDWVPPEYLTKRVTMVAPGVPRFVFTMELVARAPEQTDLVYRMARPRSAKDRRVLEAMKEPLRATLTSTAVPLIELASADARERAMGRKAEPEVPASTTRYLSEPIINPQGPIAYLPDDVSSPDGPDREAPGHPVIAS
jgi:hypothetical protein